MAYHHQGWRNRNHGLYYYYVIIILFCFLFSNESNQYFASAKKNNGSLKDSDLSNTKYLRSLFGEIQKSVNQLPLLRRANDETLYEFCRPVNKTKSSTASKSALSYETIKLNYEQSRDLENLPGVTKGPCDCAAVCEHVACKVDYTSTFDDDGLTSCTCLPEKNITSLKCGNHATCSKTEDECICKDGFKGNPDTGCKDINECDFEDDVCPKNHSCKNTEGSFECIKQEPDCWVDGRDCVPGKTCDQCCNGAYDNNGETCGGTCLPRGTECKENFDCHLCCDYDSSYWFSKEHRSCGEEPCFEDGTACEDGLSCHKCCNTAYDMDGVMTCGAECLDSGTECQFFSTCKSQCCDGESYYDDSSESYFCGTEACREDGEACSPDSDCWKCCNGAHDDDTESSSGYACGSECYDGGNKCSFMYYIPPY